MRLSGYIFALCFLTGVWTQKVPKYKPGDLVPQSDYNSISKALDDVLAAGGLLDIRTCAIGIANVDTSRQLINPTWYILPMYGDKYDSPSPDVSPKQSALHLFTKSQLYNFGTSGVISYDISNTDYKVAAFWSVPFYKMVLNTLSNVKIYNKTMETDIAMYNDLYAGAKENQKFQWIETYEHGVKILSTMTNKNNAKFYVSVDTSRFDSPDSVSPGENIMQIDFPTVDEALGQILAQANMFEYRRIAIGVSNLNMDNELNNPTWYLKSGSIYSSMPLSVPPRQTAINLFLKKQIYYEGTSGVLSYDLSGTSYKLVMFWQVPYNNALYDVLFNVKIYPVNVLTDNALYQQMQKYSGAHKSSVGSLEKMEFGIKTNSVMTVDSLINTNAKLHVSVDTSGFHIEEGPQLHGECASNILNPLWYGDKYCWKECIPAGFCWVNKKCQSNSDCTGPMPCHDTCQS